VIFQCSGLYRAGGIVEGLYGMVRLVCIPTRERGNENDTVTVGRTKRSVSGNFMPPPDTLSLNQAYMFTLNR